jgi:hypothetical protein
MLQLVPAHVAAILTLGLALSVSTLALAQTTCGTEYRIIDSIDRGSTPDCLALEPGEQATNLTGQEIIITNNCLVEYQLRCTPDFGVSSDCGIRRTVAPGESDTLAVGSASRDLIAAGDGGEHRVQVQWVSFIEPCDEGCSAASGGNSSSTGPLAALGILFWFRQRRSCRNAP